MTNPVQATPQLFQLLLVLGVLSSVVTLVAAGVSALRRRGDRARRIVARWAVGVLAYLAVSIVVSLARPVRVIEPGRDWCFDDWCLAVESVQTQPARGGDDVTYTLALRLDNAARLPEAAFGFWAYLRDQDGRLYEPAAGEWQEAVATRLPPHGSARTTMTFTVPAAATSLGFITGHGGGRCALLPSLLEIGQGGCLFGRPDRIRIR